MTNITARVVTMFPADVYGEDGVTIRKENGAFYIGYNYDVYWATRGDLLVRGDVNPQSLPAGPVDYVLTSNGPGNLPTYRPVASLSFPWTTKGDLLVRDDETGQRLPAGTLNHVLTSNGPGEIPSYQPPQTGFIPPWTTKGDLIVRGDTADGEALAAGTADHVLTSNGPGQIPSYKALASVTQVLPRNYLSGYIVQNNATVPAFDIDVSPGDARDITNNSDMRLVIQLTKKLNIFFVEGNNQGGLINGESLPANGTLHVWAITKADGTTDICANNHSISGLNPTLPTGFLYKRRIASLITDASLNIRPFKQSGDIFHIQNGIINDINTTSLGATWQFFTLSVPKGLEIEALLSGLGQHNTLNNNIAFASGNFGASGATPTALQVRGIVTFNQSLTGFTASAYTPTWLQTNTAGQILAIADNADSILQGTLHGWKDTRDKDR